MKSSSSRYYTPRTLLEIQSELNSCTDPRQALLLKAKYATVLATNSDIDAATNLIAELRQANRGFEPRLSAWLMFCDGVLIHSESLNCSSALDRFKRSYIFASAVKDHELASSCAAWMAHCYFALGEIERTADQLRLAFEWAETKDSGAIARAALVLADAFSWSGNSSLALSWYRHARNAASTFGDLAMQNAAIYNSAAFRVSNLTLSQIEGTTKDIDAKLAETEVNSALTLNTIIGNNNSPALVPLLKAELFASLGRCEEASVLFDEYFSFGNQERLARYQPKLIAQKAYCDAVIGNIDGATIGYELAMSLREQQQDLDDSAVLLYRCSQAAGILGHREQATQLCDAGQFSLTEFRKSQSSAQALFLPLVDLATDLAAPRKR